MANKVELNAVDEQNISTPIYPKTFADIVEVEDIDKLTMASELIRKILKIDPTVISIITRLGDMALENGEDLVYADLTDVTETLDNGEEVLSEINDEKNTKFNTWSAEKLESIIPDFIPLEKSSLSVVENCKSIKPTVFNADSYQPFYKTICPLENCKWTVKHTPYVEEGVLVFAVQNWYGIDTDKNMHEFIRYYNGESWSDFEKH